MQTESLAFPLSWVQRQGFSACSCHISVVTNAPEVAIYNIISGFVTVLVTLAMHVEQLPPCMVAFIFGIQIQKSATGEKQKAVCTTIQGG